MKTISLRLEDTEKEQLENYCKNNDITMSQVIRKLIKEFLANQED